MNRAAYTALIRLLSPALLAWMALRARRAGGDWQVVSGARFGRYEAATGLRRPIWIHAVSLGEMRAAIPLVRALLEEGQPVLLTHMTVTGWAEGARTFAAEKERGRLEQQWLPYDFPGAVHRFIDHYAPAVGVLIEREVWPNLIAAARRASVPMVLASARLSDHALRQSLRMGKVMRQAYGSLGSIYAQTLQDAQRLEMAGARGVQVAGNFKFDLEVSNKGFERGRAFAAALQRRVIAVASTREGEDALFVPAMVKLLEWDRRHGGETCRPLLFMLVPRHPQRFDEAEALLRQNGLPFVRRSRLLEAGGTGSAAVEACKGAAVMLGDTLGEMSWYYGASRLAIVAGSFAPLGGQNLIEPCAMGVPVIVGPHTRNFEQAAADAIEAGAALRAQSAHDALSLAVELSHESARLAAMGDAGRHWVQQHAGAVARVQSGIAELRNQSP